jgi:hypothetical protein
MQSAIRYFARTASGKSPIPLCANCYNEAFRPESWEKLQGLTGNPRRHSPSSDNIHEGERTFTEIPWGGERLPHRRDPVLRLRRPVKEWTDSAGSCSLCRIVCDLDSGGRLRGGVYTEAVVDLQLFYSELCGGVKLPWLLSVLLKLGYPKGRDVRKPKKKWERRNLVAMMFDQDEEFLQNGDACADTNPDRVSREDTIVLATRESDGSADAIELVHQARTWMEACETQHVGCGTLTNTPLPTRVLQIQARGDTFTVRLADFANGRVHGSYATLSYVWGTKTTLLLLRSNRQAFIEGIDYDELPKTMQDAVRVASALGISNLWIDALCIVQDDANDRDMELSLMCDYYQNAAVVISASGASDAHVGFLKPQTTKRQAYTRSRERVLFTDSELGAVPYRIPFRTSMGLTTCILDPQPSLYRHDAEPINGRAWTLQESTLARRLLVFPSTGGLIARCNKGVECFGEILGDPFHEAAGSLNHDKRAIGVEERGYEGSDEESADDDCVEEAEEETAEDQRKLPDTDSSVGEDETESEEYSESLRQIYQASWEFEQEANRQEQIRLAERSKEELAEKKRQAEVEIAVGKWVAVVQDYTRRNLTQPGDSLVALGGLAMDFQAKHGALAGEYAAGLWSGMMREGLLWHIPIHERFTDEGESSVLPRAAEKQFHAPSWPWASCGQPVTFETEVLPDLVMRGRPEQPHWCIEVLDCQTLLKSERNHFGAVLEGCLDVMGTLLPIELSQTRRDGFPKRSVRNGPVEDVRLADGEGKDSESQVFCVDSPEAGASMLEGPCFWMPVRYITLGDTRGLLVRQEADGKFRRVGYAEFRFHSVGSREMRMISII